ncbi:MAG TPA: Holliday junction branch migration protein RuvA [Actinomycetota bacterium]|nr:Holliday junction branch migration protein RuvA [Actinomycetota bacterium]
MISSVRGTITELGLGAVEVDVNGVGYYVAVSSSTLRNLRLGEKVRLLTQMVVREDSMSLYGFPDMEQRDLFRSLTSVTGVGPKLALAVQGHLKPDALRRAIASSDVDALVEVPGVGKRSAQRMILELKTQLGIPESGLESAGSKVAEVREALLGLGYAPGELAGVLDKVASEDGKVEDMVKSALKALSRV